LAALVERVEQSVTENPDEPATLDEILAGLEKNNADKMVLLRVRDAAAGSFVDLARQAIADGDTVAARSLLEKGAARSPSVSIGDEIDLLRRQLDRQEAFAAAGDEQQRIELEEQSEAELLGLAQQLDQGLSQPVLTVMQARSLLGLLNELEARGADVASDSRARIAELLISGSEQLARQNRWTEALTAARGASALMPGAAVLSENLTRLEAENLGRLNRERVAESVAALDDLLTSPRFDLEWSELVNREIARLSSLLPADDATLAGATQQTAMVYLQRAQDMRRAQRFELAEQALTRASALMPGFAGLALEQDRLEQARTEYGQRTESRARLAQIDSLKEQLRQEARAGQLDRARRTLEELQRELPADNEFLVVEGPSLIAAAYLDSAESAARRRQFDQALALIDRGLEFAPDNASLMRARSRMEEARVRQGDGQSPSSGYRSVDGPGTGEQRVTASSLAEQIRAELSGADTIDEATMGAGLEQLQSLDPRLFEQTRAWLSGQFVAQIERSLAAGRLADAESRKQMGLRLLPSDADILALTIPAPPPRGPDPCSAPGLPRQGATREGTCRDALAAGGNGPYLVVVPGVTPGDRPFAISKYEITIREYNGFCDATGRCSLFEAPDDLLPVTRISVADANAYADWLSQQTGRRYRLPTSEEWEHAARADTGAIRWSFNCQDHDGGKLSNGVALQPVTSGIDNNWGLRNYIGNAREWTTRGDALEVRGGAYTDSREDCSIRSHVAHDGVADRVTGMRLVRVLD
jgi:non-specific serine/threonine protein kinase